MRSMDINLGDTVLTTEVFLASFSLPLLKKGILARDWQAVLHYDEVRIRYVPAAARAVKLVKELDN